MAEMYSRQPKLYKSAFSREQLLSMKFADINITFDFWAYIESLEPTKIAEGKFACDDIY